MHRYWLVLLSLVLLADGSLAAQDNNPPSVPQPNDAASAMAMHDMSSHHMEMGSHMKMTALRKPKPGDRERAEKVVKTARAAIEQYRDYIAALNSGFEIFLPNLPQKVYHFTNYSYGREAVFQFNPEHPTSLLYEKTTDGYRLVGAMYTAAPRATEDQLDERVPLSIAQWHVHVNFCLPPPDRREEALQPHPLFGLAGSIFTKPECDKAGGRFVPQLFGWMVHVYPFEQKQKDIWAVEPHESGETPHSH